MKTFRQLREELSPELTVSFKSPIDKPRKPYKNVGGRKIRYYDPENDGKNDLKKISTPAYKIFFNKKDIHENI